MSKNKIMEILVLGSDGQIGRPLTFYLKARGHSVFEFDNYSNPINDLRVPSILDGLLPKIDFVFFLAFDVGGSVYLKRYQDTFEFISNNIKIMNNTFDSLRKYDTPFVFASSQMSGMSHSTYGILKHIGEKYTNCLNGKVLKFWNVYGLEHPSEKSHVINDFISMARNNNRIDMKTDGKELRQFLYTEDCSECLNIIMNRFDEIKEQQLDVSNFSWTTIREVAEIISGYFNGCPIFAGVDSDDVQRNALKEPQEDILKYWQPRTPIEVGIKKIINNEGIYSNAVL